MSISVGSVSVDVVPSTKTFATDLKAKTRDVSVDVRVNPDTAEFTARMEEITRPRTATINANADTGAAEAKLDFVARNRRSRIEVGVIGAALASLATLPALLAAVGPALIPITVAIGGLAAALVAPLALAGGGLTIGALIAGKAIADTEKQQKNIADLAKKVTAAKLAVSQAATPAGKKSAMLREAEAVKAYQVALAGLTPTQRKFIEAQGRLKDSFGKLVAAAGPAIFGPVIKGMDLLAGVLPKLQPLLRGVASGVDTLLTDLGKAASGPGFKSFAKAFGAGARDAIVTFGRIFGSVGSGLVSFFRAFAPVSKAFAKGLGSAASGFADWAKSLGSSKSFQGFLGYVKDVGPKVADMLGHTFKALGKIAAVMAPLGGLALGLVDGLSQLVNNIKPAQLAAIATAIGAIGVAVLFATGGLSGIVPAILGIGTGLAYAYKHSAPFHKAVDTISRVFTDHLLPALKDAWKTVLPGLSKGFDNVKDSVQKNHGLFAVIGDVFKGIGKVIVNVVIPAVAKFYSVYLPLLGKAIGIAITGIKLLADGLLAMAQFGLQAFRLLTVAALSTFGAILTAADKGLGWIPGIGPKIHAARKAFDNFKDGTVASLDKAIGKVQELRNELDGLKSKDLEVRLKVTTQQLVQNPSLGKPRVLPEGAGARGAIINRPTVLLAGEAGREALVPLDRTTGNEPLPRGSSGPQFRIDKVVAQDVNDFLRQMQERARRVAVGGLP